MSGDRRRYFLTNRKFVRGTKQMFPERINEYVGALSYRVDSIGRSEDEVYLFEDKYVLKISRDSKRLIREQERVDFLYHNNIPGSRSVCIIEENGRCYYLRTYISGKTLIDERYLNDPDLLIDILVNTVNVLRSADDLNCPYKSNGSYGNDFVHGDLCLPNILVNENDEFMGFIDLENSGLGDKWYDYSWLLWSLEYNLKSNKFHGILLKKLGLKFDEEKYAQYIPEEYRQRR